MKPLNAVPVLRRLACLLLLSAAAAAQPVTPPRTVIHPVINMYSSATLDADVVSQAIYATTVNVLEEKESWTRIRTPDDYTGWVESAALVTLASPTPYASGRNVVRVRSLFAHLYRETSVTKHAPILTVPFETRLELDVTAQDAEGWFAVRLPDGRTAFVQNGDVAAPGPPLSVDQTIALARRFLGVPYTWGGTSSYGYDCSGFVQMLMRQRGYSMPRDAGPQARWSGLAPVEKTELKAGDLLYFGSSEERITHTGMYIGDGQFINATTYDTPMVRIDNLNEPRWTRLLVATRRVRP